MNNIHNVEKTMLKFQQLAKDAQSNGDPVLVENYLQHADHYARRLAELNEKNRVNSNDNKKDSLPETHDENKLTSKVNDESKSSN
jgi:hypothetical protein